MAASPAKSRSSRLLPVLNVVVSQLDTAIVTAGSFVVTPAVLHGLGDGGYGGWLLINSFVSYIRLLDHGTTSGTMKFGAGAHERGDARDVARVMNTSSAMFLAIAATAMTLTLGLTELLPRLYPTIATGQSTAILVLGGALALDLCFRPFAAALRMRSLFFVYDGIEICTYCVFKLGLVVYFAYHGALSYRVLALLTLGDTLARIVFVVGASLAISPTMRRVNPFRAELAMARKLAGMGAAVSVIVVADIVRFQLDAGVIGYFIPDSPQKISIFGVGTRLPSIAFTAISVIGSVLMPRFSGLAETGDKGSTSSLLARANLVTGLATSFALVNIAVLGPQFLELWLHKPWVATSGRILWIMLPAYYVAALTAPSASLLMGRARVRGLMVLTVVEALFNFGLSVILVRPLGIYGVALGTAIPMALFRGVAFPWLLQRELDLAPLAYYRMHARAIAVALLYLLLVGGLVFVGLPSYGRFLLLAAAGTAVFVCLAIAVVPDVRTALGVLLRRRSRSTSEPSGAR